MTESHTAPAAPPTAFSKVAEHPSRPETTPHNYGNDHERGKHFRRSFQSSRSPFPEGKNMNDRGCNPRMRFQTFIGPERAAGGLEHFRASPRRLPRPAGFFKGLLAVWLVGCLFAGSLAEAAPDGSLTDTNIKYFGRWDFSNPAQYASYWGGAYLRAGFTGTTAQIKLGNTSDFYAKIDGGPWQTFAGAGGTVNLTPSPLTNGAHVLSVAQGKDYDYVFQFQGLVLDAGATTALPPVSATLIEFIGDSITTGYTDPQADVSDYAWICAEKLNCEHTQIAYPGVALVTGYGVNTDKTGMDSQYFKAQSFANTGSPAWDFTKYTPRLVVVNLGQNDSEADLVFQSNYVTFLANIRAEWPNADIFALRPFSGVKPSVLFAVNARIQSGDLKVHYINTAGWLTSGDYNDGVHPSVSGHIKAANYLKAGLVPYLGGDVVGKITVGYQGWFSAAGDGSPVNNWAHENLEMWPDAREYATTYAGTPFNQAAITQPAFFVNLGNGQPAKMFSAYDQQVVNTHFRWMAENNIDCVALQRFANEISPGSTIKAQRDGMALKVMNAALATGRKFYIEYDASGRSTMNHDIKVDWTNTIVNALHLTSSSVYAKQNGKPVVGVYGMGYATAPNPGPGSTNDCLDLIAFLKAQGCYIMGGVPGQWGTGTGDSRPDCTAVYQALDMIGPWAVGRATDSGYLPYLTADSANCVSNGMDYLPNAYPGTSFYNSNSNSPMNQFPRSAGNFLWTQLSDMRSIGAPSVFIAMFDEMNEATPVFKCAEDASMSPTGNWFLTLDADGTHCSSDFYLRLVKDGGNMIKGLAPLNFNRPTVPVLPFSAPVPPVGLVALGTNGRVSLSWTAAPGAKSYTVKRSGTSGGPYNLLATNVGGLSFTDAGLTNGVPCHYVVGTSNSLGQSGNSLEAVGVPFAAVASASSQNLPSEGAAQAFDGSISTKWFNANGGNTGWLQYYFGGSAQTVIGYTLTSGNDTPGRDPKNWQFQGSQEGSVWTTLDTRTGEAFVSRNLGKQYVFNNSTAYGYYRLNVTANNGDATGIQLDEMAFAYAAAIPAAVTASAFSTSQIVLGWTPSAGATGYNIKRSAVPGGPYTTIATNILAAFYWDGTLAANSAYYYVVSAANAAMESSNSVEVSATTLKMPPPVVSGLTAAAGNSQVTLNWNTIVGATNYNIKRSLVSGGPYSLVGGSGQTNYTDTGLANDIAWYYVVSTLSPGGESANSVQVAATPSANLALNRSGWLASSSGGEPPANAIDGDISTRWSTDALQAGGEWFQVDMQTTQLFGKIVLDTTPSPNDYPRGYQVNISSDGINWGSPVATGNGSSAVTTIPLGPQTARYIRVTQTSSTPGNYWSIHEFNVYGTPPAAPAPTAMSGDGQATLSWMASVGATGYNVKTGPSTTGPFMTIAPNFAAAPYVSGGLANGTIYYFAVSAMNMFGEGTNSATVIAHPVSFAPPGLGFGFDGNSVQFNWTPDHVGWRLEMQANSGGLGDTWFPVAGSEMTNQLSIPINPANGNVFFRLVYP